jgi:hypothetical protein
MLNGLIISKENNYSLNIDKVQKRTKTIEETAKKIQAIIVQKTIQFL